MVTSQITSHTSMSGPELFPTAKSSIYSDEQPLHELALSEILRLGLIEIEN